MEKQENIKLTKIVKKYKYKFEDEVFKLGEEMEEVSRTTITVPVIELHKHGRLADEDYTNSVAIAKELFNEDPDGFRTGVIEKTTIDSPESADWLED